jgi:septum formation protein
VSISGLRPLITLASTSPRRSELLTEAGIPFEVRPAYIEELADPELSARELCLINAESKALEVANRFPNRLVLGADTVVSLDNRTFGKPGDLAEARRMLETLCGRVHEVLTGVCLVHRDREKMVRFVESTRVKFRPREEVDLDAYLASVNPLDKAGAYAAQEDEGRLIAHLEGSMSNVVGLPVERLRENLREHFPEGLPG